MRRWTYPTGLLAPLVLWAALCLWTGKGMAQEPVQAPPAQEEAAPEEPGNAADDLEQQLKQHVQLGDQLFMKGDYEAAIKEYRAANELDSQPIFLYKVARCYHRLERMKEALDLYKRFLHDEPQTPLKIEVDRSIRELQVKLDESQKPVWKKGWFWGVVAGAAVVAGVGIGLGVYYGRKPGIIPVQPGM